MHAKLQEITVMLKENEAFAVNLVVLCKGEKYANFLLKSTFLNLLLDALPTTMKVSFYPR